MGSRAPDPTLPFTYVLWLWTDPFPSRSLHPPIPKMKGSEVQVFWTFLKCIKSFQDCNQNWNKPVENASKPCGHRAYLHDASLPDESSQTPQTVASLCLLTWFHFLCCFLPPCPTPDKVNKDSIKTPCLETWLIAAPLCWHTALGATLSPSPLTVCIEVFCVGFWWKGSWGGHMCGYGRPLGHCNPGLWFWPGSSVRIILFLLSSSSKEPVSVRWPRDREESDQVSSRLSEASHWWDEHSVHQCTGARNTAPESYDRELMHRRRWLTLP